MSSFVENRSREDTAEVALETDAKAAEVLGAAIFKL